MCSRGYTGQHPNDEEMIGYHGILFCETNRLDQDAGEDLLVGEGKKELSCYFGFGSSFAQFLEDDVEGEDKS